MRVMMADKLTFYTLRESRSKPSASVICLPGAGAGIISFLELVDFLPGNYSYFGFQPRGLEQGEEPYPCLEYMVETYLQQLLSRKSELPYLFIGHSFGGWVALELARNLKRKKLPVGPLVLLDVSAPQNPHRHLSRMESLLELIEVMEMTSGGKFNLTEELLSKLDENAQLEAIHRNMVSLGLLPSKTNCGVIQGMVNVFIANGHMEFWPDDQYLGAALLIDAKDSKEQKELRHDNFSRWLNFIPELRYAESSGNHFTLLNQPNAEKLAQIIAEVWTGN